MEWLDTHGKPIACKEKQQLLDENLQELAAMAQDALDDALLMGVSANQFKQAVSSMAKTLTPSVKERS